MSNYKILPANITAASLENFDNAVLNYTKYLITIATPQSDKFVAVAIHRIDKRNPFTVIASNEYSLKGEVTVPLGYFSPGTKIGLFWLVEAASPISNIVVLVTNDTTKVTRKVAPDVTPKLMKRTERWSEKKDEFTLF
jgi:hypothetical protein